MTGESIMNLDKFKKELTKKRELEIFEFLFTLTDDNIIKIYNKKKNKYEFENETFTTIQEVWFIYNKVIKCYNRKKRKYINKGFGKVAILRRKK